MTNPRIQVDPEKVEKLAQVCDSEEEIALSLGISYSTFRRRKAEFEQFEQAVKRGKAKANIFVGGKLMKQIEQGNTAATIFYLKSRCGWKEIDRREITGANGGAVKVDTAPDLSGVDLEKLKAVREMLYGDDKTADSD